MPPVTARASAPVNERAVSVLEKRGGQLTAHLSFGLVPVGQLVAWRKATPLGNVERGFSDFVQDMFCDGLFVFIVAYGATYRLRL
jgi:hypothetical protein